MALASSSKATGREGFGKHLVGTEYKAGLQISYNQIRKPLGERLMTPHGKFMGSTVSPDVRFRQPRPPIDRSRSRSSI